MRRVASPEIQKRMEEISASAEAHAALASGYLAAAEHILHKHNDTLYSWTAEAVATAATVLIERSRWEIRQHSKLLEQADSLTKRHSKRR